MQNCKRHDTLVSNGDKFSLGQCLKDQIESKLMQKVFDASAIGSLMYLQVCTRPYYVFICGMLSR